MTDHRKPYGCGKRRFTSRRKAKKFVKARNDQKNNRVYRCDEPGCDGHFWHTTRATAEDAVYFREGNHQK